MSGAAKLFLSIVILRAFLFSGLAQQTPKSPAGTRFALVNILDAHGNVVRDLTEENFRVRLDGKPVAVFDARYSLAPRRIVVLLDMSGSMTGERSTEKWPIACEAVEDLLAETPGDVPIAMLTFAGKVRDVFDFSQGRSAITKWLTQGPGRRPNLKYPARTALFDAILEGLKLLSSVESGDAIYAITDGGDNASQASAVQTNRALRQSGVRLFAFLFAEALRVVDEKWGKDSFLEMVDDSGGFVFRVPGSHRPGGASWDFEYIYDKGNREKVKAYTKELNIQISGFWTLELAVPSSNKESKMKLEVVGHDGRIRKDLGVTYPRVLFAGK